jgi:hypothetical protein
VEGLGFIYQFRKRHPWAAMSAIYSDPPRSTAQILHPEKYFDRREDPVAIAIPDLSRLLPGSHLVSDDDLGEFSLGAVLALHLGDTEGPRAAIGWRGDRYRIWGDAAGRFTIAYRVVVANQQMAVALAEQLRASVERRHPELAGKAAGPTGGLVTWAEEGRAFAVERRGTSVVLLEQFPVQTVDRARDAVWRVRPASGPR